MPDDAAIAERTRRGQFLTRPELAVLLAYAKLTLYDDLLVTSVPDDLTAAALISVILKSVKTSTPNRF